MKEKADSVGVKLARLLDIPLDTASDWPRIVLDADRSATVQNHCGVMEYDKTQVRIHTKRGDLAFLGTGLTLMYALQEEIVVQGKIERIEFVDWR